METVLTGFQEAGADGGKAQVHFEEVQKSNIAIYAGNDEYMRTLETLSRKIKFIEADVMVKSSKALKDVHPEVKRLRQKAASMIFEFVIQKFYALRNRKQIFRFYNRVFFLNTRTR